MAEINGTLTINTTAISGTLTVDSNVVNGVITIGSGAGGIGGAVNSVNGATGVVVLDADDIDDTSTTNKFTTAAEATKLAGIEALAEVNDTGAEIVTKLNAALGGTTWQTDTDTQLSDNQVVAAVNTILGGTDWQTDTQLTNAEVVAAVNAQLGNTDWQTDGTQIASEVPMTGYVKPASGGAISPADSVDQAIGKLETGLENATAGGGGAGNAVVLFAVVTADFTVTNNTTLQAIPGVATLTIPGGKLCSVVAQFNLQSNGAPDSKIGIIPISGNISGRFITDLDGISSVGNEFALGGFVPGLGENTSPRLVQMMGNFETVGETTVSLAFAQQADSALESRVVKGSWIQITYME